jgi:hypothetical protein
MSPLGTAATVWLIVPVPDDRWWWWWLWSCRWNANWQGKPKYSDKTCPSVTWSIINPTSPDTGSTSRRRGGKPTTNCLSYGTALMCNVSRIAYHKKTAELTAWGTSVFSYILRDFLSRWFRRKLIGDWTPVMLATIQSRTFCPLVCCLKT